jgi:tartrate/fumarate subfamily iron-sulfur-dependent hydro-lyase beta chain
MRLRLPLTGEQIQGLRLGDVVFLDGVVYTGRTFFHERVLKQGILPPIDFNEANVLCHMGPVMKRDEGREDGWEPLCIGGTASMRFEAYAASVIERLKIRAIVGKGTMGPASMEAMRRFGCVHLCSVGLYAKVLSTKIRRVICVYGLQEMGMIEATWLLHVEDFGPFIVDVDTQGENLFHQVHQGLEARVHHVYHRFGISRPPEPVWQR